MDLRQRLASALLGRYAVEHEVGRGGMAVVYLARDLRHSRDVAVKVLRPELAASLGSERFLREIQVAASLAHPHIVPLYDSGEGNGCLYYVMPHVAGESLRDRLLRDGRLGVGEAVGLSREVADALEFAHRAGVVHRDIKPENILLQAGHAVVADFGIARAISAAGGSRMTESGIAVGTPDYMSPEQAAGDEHVDGRSDIYSLGCVAFEMLVGRPPFSGTTPQKVLAQKLGQAAPALSSLQPLPAAVSHAVARALAKNPEDRFPTAADFGAALAGWETAPEFHAGRLGRIAAALGAVAVIGALAFAWWWNREHGGARSARGTAFDPTHIAVLYFDVLNDSARLEPVAAGLTEDLIDALSQVEALNVKSPAGVRPYRGQSVPPDSIGRALAVATLVTGSVAGSRDSLRVIVRLIDAPSSRQLHSQTVTRPWGDLFQLEDSLAADLATFLRERLGEAIELRERRSGTKSVEAWHALRQADALREEAGLLRRGGDQAAAIALLRRADAVYVEAERLDHRWIVPILERGRVALDLSELAQMRSLEDARQHPNPGDPTRRALAVDEWVRIGLRHTRRALDINPREPRALELRGTLRYRLWVDSYVTDAESLAAAERDLRQAVAQDAALARAWYNLSELLRFTGRFTEADWAARGALDADAYLAEAVRVYHTLFFTALNRERYDEARTWCGLSRARFPNISQFRDCELQILGWSARGPARVAAAWREVATIEAGRPDEQSGPFWADRRLLVAAILARSGMADSARAVIRLARAGDPADSAASWMLGEEAWVRVLLGERDEALRLLARFVESAGQMRPYLAVSPWYASLRSDPRFQALVGQSRMAP